MPTYLVSTNSYQAEVTVDTDGSVALNGTRLETDIKRVEANSFSVISKGKTSKVVIERVGSTYQVLLGPFAREFVVRSERDRLLESYGAQAISVSQRLEIRAPMPALVVKLEVEEGQAIQSGDGLIRLEAMKMENEIKAHQSGIVKRIHAVQGKAVEKGELLIVLE